MKHLVSVSYLFTKFIDAQIVDSFQICLNYMYLAGIAEKYSLKDHLSDSDLNLKSSQNEDHANKSPKIYFEDGKLQEMWSQAQESGFSGT